MKCPKCGYNSFEYLDQCKKCHGDLSAFKTSHGIKAVILPLNDLQEDHPDAEESAPPFSTDMGVLEGDEGGFSWQGTSESTAENLSPSGLPSFDLDLPHPAADADPFGFDLDLPAAPPQGVAAAPAADEFSIEGLEEAPVFARSEPSVEVQPEQPSEFGEFSFDDLYKQQDEPPLMETTPEPPPAEFTLETAGLPLEEEMPQLTLDDLQTPEASEKENLFGIDEPFAAENTEGEEDEVDTMGLSPEEYQLLFGEPPAKKKVKA